MSDDIGDFAGLDEREHAPWLEDALTIDEAIAVLERIKLQHGGDVPLWMADQEPVVRIFFDRTSDSVCVTDRYEARSNKPDWLARALGN